MCTSTDANELGATLGSGVAACPHPADPHTASDTMAPATILAKRGRPHLEE
jgi:hypothetical protein